MDVTFCQRRDAENCTVTLLSSKKRLVLASVVVSKTEEALPAQGLEFEASKKGLKELSQDLPVSEKDENTKIMSITNICF